MIVTFECFMCHYKFQDGVDESSIGAIVVCPECRGLCTIVEELE